MQKIRIIEWEDRPRSKVKTRKKKVRISPDAYQVLEWIIREALLEVGFCIGFQADMPRIKRSNFSSAHDYVIAIIDSIESEERKRKKRFRAAKKYYDYMKLDSEPETYEIDRYLEEIGADAKGSAYGAKLTIHRPEEALSYGFEKLVFATMPDLVRLRKALVELGFENQREFNDSQIEILRKKLDRPGRLLVQTPEGSWTFDFTNLPLIKNMVFYSVVLYRKLQNPPGQTNEFVSRKIRYFFRGLGDLNAILRRDLSANLIRERIKGDKDETFLNQCEQMFINLDLISEDLFECLEDYNGISRAGVTQYLNRIA